jgi:hypothetical protein
LWSQLTLGPQLSRNVDVIELLNGCNKAAVSRLRIAWGIWGHRKLMTSTLCDDGGGAIAGVRRLPLSVSLTVAPLLGWIK